MSVQTWKSFGVSGSYDGKTFRQIFTIDPSFIIPGFMLILLAITVTFFLGFQMVLQKLLPFVASLVPLCLGILLIMVGWFKKHYFEAGPGFYRIGWSIGPITRIREIPAAKASLRIRKHNSRSGTEYDIAIKTTWRKRSTWITGTSPKKMNEWLIFLKALVAGKEGVIMPDDGPSTALLEAAAKADAKR